MTPAERFTTHLRHVMEEADLTQLELGTRLGHKSNALVGEVLRGLKMLPLGAVSDWAHCLGLEGAARDRFIDLAICAYGTEEMRFLVGQRRASYP